VARTTIAVDSLPKSDHYPVDVATGGLESPERQKRRADLEKEMMTALDEALGDCLRLSSKQRPAQPRTSHLPLYETSPEANDILYTHCQSPRSTAENPNELNTFSERRARQAASISLKLEPKPEPAPKSDPESESKPESDADPAPEEPEPESELAARLALEPEPKPELAPEAIHEQEPELELELELEPEPEPEPEPALVPEAEAQLMPELASELEQELAPEPEPQPELETGAELSTARVSVQWANEDALEDVREIPSLKRSQHKKKSKDRKTKSSRLSDDIASKPQKKAMARHADDIPEGGQELRDTAQRKLCKALIAGPEGKQRQHVDKVQRRAAQRGARRAEAALFAHHDKNRRAYRASIRVLAPLLHEGCVAEGAAKARSSLLSSESEDDAALTELILALLSQQGAGRDSQ
jgi:hypothetical protein